MFSVSVNLNQREWRAKNVRTNLYHDHKQNAQRPFQKRSAPSLKKEDKKHSYAVLIIAYHGDTEHKRNRW